VLRIPLIHALALVAAAGRVHVEPPPRCLVFAAAIMILYFPCRWFAGVNARRTDWRLRHL
jgi:hypothetical protein